MLPIHPVSREQVEIEARAKCFWGDSREEVVKYMMMQGLSAAEATELAEGMFQERAKTIRGMGLTKLLWGIPLMAIPVAAWFYFISIKIIPTKIFALTLMVGFYGVWLFLKGSIMFFSPKSEPGDVADK